MLRIGYDAKRLFNNFTGLGNYSRTLLSNLAEYYPENAYYLYTPKIDLRPENQHFSNNPAFTVRTPARKWLGSWWRTSGLKGDLVKKKIDLYHGLSHEIPLGMPKTGIKTIVTIHDLIFKRYPEFYAYLDRNIYDWKFGHACRNADRIITISEQTKRDVIHFYGVHPEKIDVVYQSCHDQFKQKKSRGSIRTVLDKYGIPDNFLLYVGSLSERKNVLGILKVYEVLKESERLPLVIVGGGKKYKKLMEQYIASHRLGSLVKFLQIQDHELPALYQAASIFIYISFYEGFGLPLIEALFSQTPVITSNISSLPEAAGPGSILIDPSCTEELAEGIRLLLNDSERRAEVVAKGYQYAQKFRAQPLTEQLMNIYKQLLKSKGI